MFPTIACLDCHRVMLAADPVISHGLCVRCQDLRDGEAEVTWLDACPASNRAPDDDAPPARPS